MKSINDILDEIEELSFNDRVFFFDIAGKRFAEEKRKLLIDNVNKSEKEILKGDCSSGSSEELFKNLGI